MKKAIMKIASYYTNLFCSSKIRDLSLKVANSINNILSYKMDLKTAQQSFK